MMEAVHHYEGTVNQVMGDGIMALFGAPRAHEDHAVRGCYAARRMQRRVISMLTNSSAEAVQRCGSVWGSIPARSSCAPSVVTCTWTTPPSGRRWPWWARRGWASRASPGNACGRTVPMGG
jgi:hypothetical protein